LKSPSQYPGTLKTTVCSRCNTNLDHLKAEDQEKHAIECIKQGKLFE
jgi:hypothetical protein